MFWTNCIPKGGKLAGRAGDIAIQSMKVNVLHTIPIDIYNRDLYLWVGDWEKGLLAIGDEMADSGLSKPSDVPTPGERTTGRYVPLDSGDAFVWIKNDLGFDNTISVLAHELTHATIDIYRDVGIKLSSKSEEAYAYLMGYLMHEATCKLGAPIIKQDKHEQD